MPRSERADLMRRLAHVLWLGGATDAGKTTTAHVLAARYGLRGYAYDRHDLPHYERLAQTSGYYRAELSASLDERWVAPTPEALLRRDLRSFRDRWPLVVEDLLALPTEPLVVAEGDGLTPDLVAPVLASARQAIWLVPTEGFKAASMRRRNKPSFLARVSDPDRARANVEERDRLFAEEVRMQAQAHGVGVYEVDGSRSAEEIATVLADHYAPFFRGARKGQSG